MTGEMPSLGQAPGDAHEPVYSAQRNRLASVGRSSNRFDSDNNHALNLVQQEIRSKLKNVLRKKKFYGYPINMPFTDVNMVTERVGLYGCNSL